MDLVQIQAFAQGHFKWMAALPYSSLGEEGQMQSVNIFEAVAAKVSLVNISFKATNSNRLLNE